MSASPGSITARNRSRMEVVVMFAKQYDELKRTDAPQVEFVRLVTEYEQYPKMIAPAYMKEAAGIVRSRTRKRDKFEYRNRIIALLEHGPQSIRRIGAVLGRSQTQTAEMVNRMAGEGLVKRCGPGLANWTLCPTQPKLMETA